MNHAVFAEKTAPLGVVTLGVLDEGLVRERPSLKVYHVHLFLLNQNSWNCDDSFIIYVAQRHYVRFSQFY